MRRIAIMLLVLLAAVLVLAACGGGSQAPAAEDSVAESIGAAPAAESEEDAATEEASEETASEEAPAEEAQADEAAPGESAMGEVTMDGSMLMLPEVDPLTVEGDVVTAGSSTVFPLAEAVGERFYDEGYGGTITIDSIGSGAGFSRFCEAGETDISTASRGIKDVEVESCGTFCRNPFHFRVGTDALAGVNNSYNDGLADGVTVEELAPDILEVRGEPVTAVRYKLTAKKMDLTLWYSEDQDWLALESVARGGHVIRYELS